MSNHNDGTAAKPGVDPSVDDPEMGNKKQQFDESEFTKQFDHLLAGLLPAAVVEHTLVCDKCGARRARLKAAARAVAVNKGGQLDEIGLISAMGTEDDRDFSDRDHDSDATSHYFVPETPAILATGDGGLAVVLVPAGSVQYLAVLNPAQRGVIVYKNMEDGDAEAEREEVTERAIAAVNQRSSDLLQAMLEGFIKSRHRRSPPAELLKNLKI